MNSLKDSWQISRQQRQQELAQRRVEVQQTLNTFQAKRRSEAIQVRHDLSQFQQELQQATQAFLSAAAQHRQVQSQQLMQRLHSFAQLLQVETDEFLSQIASDRVLRAQQIVHDLAAFRNQLSISVSALLQEFQTKRQHDQIQILQELTAYFEHLQSDVQIYLAELEMLRDRRAQKVWQELQQSRVERLAAVDVLFQTFVEFRAELREYCGNMKTVVWGQKSAPSVPSVVESPKAESPQPIKPAKSKAIEPVSTESASLPQPVPPSKAAPITPPPAAAPKLPPLELEICEHIRKMQGARLPEIEAALGINRFQAVDALRVLIKEGIVTQRDRVYLIQEESL